jgi:hypothetical protein
MKSRTLVILVLVVLVLATAAVAFRQQGGGLLTDWLYSLHGRPPGH